MVAHVAIWHAQLRSDLLNCLDSIYNHSSGCSGAVSNKDAVNFTGSYKFTPKTTITSP